ncbi:MAG TPA: cysteine desulfurase family protein [Vicinamibacterales bacterium]|nr:cysteine desulfurase family protein [Vicinamibacterales bacterium]
MRIYLDYNATAPPAPGVVDAVCRVLQDIPGNPSSIHTPGQQARAVLDTARHAVAALIGAAASDVILTGGGTESDNLAIRGAAEALQGNDDAGRRHLVTSAIEHEAVLATCAVLERRGWRVTRLAVGRSGMVSPADVEAALAAAPGCAALVSIMHANNEIGTLQPIAEIAAIARTHGALCHTDAVQTVGKIPVSVSALGVDLLSLSGHKFGGPKGTGALWLRRGLRLQAQQTGGKQERSRRAGTENVAGLAGLGAAADYARATLEEHMAQVARLRDRLEHGIVSGVSRTEVNGERSQRVPNTTNISVEGVEAELLLMALDLDGIAVSTGAACSSGSLEPSHVLKAMGLPSARARTSLRFSLGPATTEQEIDDVIARLPALVDKLRRLGRTAAGIGSGSHRTAER